MTPTALSAMHHLTNPLFVDALAQLPLEARLTLFALLGLMAGAIVNMAVKHVPAIIERAWQAELAAAQQSTGALCNAQENAFALSLPTASHSLTRRIVILIASITLGTLIAWRFGPTWQTLGAMLLAYTLIALALIDVDTQLLPDILTLPLLWAGLLCNLGHWFTALPDAVIGAAVGYLSLWLLYWLHRLWRGQEGMGFGDFKLAAALGAWFGWSALLQIFTIASLLALFVAGIAWLSGRLGRHQAFAFGPFLAAAGLVTLLCGDGFTYWLGVSS